MRSYKRKFRYFLIDKQFQSKYILLTILLLLAYTFMFVVILLSPYMLTLYFDFPLAEQTEAAKTLLILHSRMWLAIGTVILIMGGLSIFITHKIAGPLYRLKKALQEITDGNLETTVTLRRWDDLQDLAKQVNLLTAELRTFVTTLKNDYVDLSDYIETLEKEIQMKTLNEDSGREIILQIQERRKNIAELLDKYQI